MRLKNKTALVTGAASGIGKAIALQFLEEGASVLLTDFNEKNLLSTKKEFQERKFNPLTFVCDVTDEKSVQELIQFSKKAFSFVDILVNNAGIMDDFIPAHAATDELWSNVMGVNLNGPFWLCRGLLPQMLENKKGSIVNISSVAGLGGGKAGFCYTVSKHALIGLTQQIAYCYAEKGIRCNTIAPGPVNTGIGLEMKPDAFGYARFEKGQSTIIRSGEPSEIASVAVFLGSDEASFVNGAVLVADAGWSVY
jgi:NAD(P)-dependent dehydrogenase (short-subunit alcohol dehydrogenase family)